jgi:hypothetical protein
MSLLQRTALTLNSTTAGSSSYKFTVSNASITPPTWASSPGTQMITFSPATFWVTPEPKQERKPLHTKVIQHSEPDALLEIVWHPRLNRVFVRVHRPDRTVYRADFNSALLWFVDERVSEIVSELLINAGLKRLIKFTIGRLTELAEELHYDLGLDKKNFINTHYEHWLMQIVTDPATGEKRPLVSGVRELLTGEHPFDMFASLNTQPARREKWSKEKVIDWLESMREPLELTAI